MPLFAFATLLPVALIAFGAIFGGWAGLVALGYMWGLQVKAAQEKLANASGDAQYFENKIATARFFFDRIMPESSAHLARISTGADSMMAIPEEAF